MPQDRGPIPGIQKFVEKGTGTRRDFGRAIWDALKIGGAATIAAEALASCSNIDQSHVVPTQKNLEGEVGRQIEIDLHNLQLVNVGAEVRVARYYTVSSHQGGRDERDLKVNVYSVNGDPNALVYDVQAELLQSDQESLNEKGWWGVNVVGDMIAKDSSLAQPDGDTRPMVGMPYTSFANDETNDNTENPSGPVVLLALVAGNGQF